ncbi:MAG: hypothetical protein K9K64_04075 [Desulfohalobiaceae bacterium]|nr:hypothetical protein [Desulfohalobiaceae bacterium]
MNSSTKLFKNPIPVFILSGLLAVIFSLAGCAYQSVAHLKRNPWQPEKEQTLNMNYLVFDYTCRQETESLSVSGMARLKSKSVPDWAVQAKDVWLGAYLSDQRGGILAKDLIILQTGRLDIQKGFAFDFELTPESMGSAGPLFITFGYRLVLTTDQQKGRTISTESDSKSEENVFFASESAMFYK